MDGLAFHAALHRNLVLISPQRNPRTLETRSIHPVQLGTIGRYTDRGDGRMFLEPSPIDVDHAKCSFGKSAPSDGVEFLLRIAFARKDPSRFFSKRAPSTCCQDQCSSRANEGRPPCAP